MGILDILKQYADPATAETGDVAGHFDQVAQHTSTQDLGNSVAAAFRSDATPPFGQMIGDLFAKSDPNQRAGILNQIVQSVGAGGLASIAGGVLGRVLGPAAARAARRRRSRPSRPRRSRPPTPARSPRTPRSRTPRSSTWRRRSTRSTRRW